MVELSSRYRYIHMDITISVTSLGMNRFRNRAVRAIGAALVSATWLWVASPSSADDEPISIFAAASLKGALDEVAANWEKNSAKKTSISYGATSALAKQIEQGAPADIFISADEDWMNELQAKQLIVLDTRKDLLGNALVLIAASDSALKAELSPGLDLAGMLGSGRLAMADTNSVPAGKYGKAALQSLGLWTSLNGKLAEAENVRAALQLVALGEAPLGIVYATDAQSDARIRVLDLFPADSHPPIRYPVALVSASQTPAARDFLAYLSGEAATNVFQSYGFEVLP
jgi:molybdate transport system substrate-binding protein